MDYSYQQLADMPLKALYFCSLSTDAAVIVSDGPVSICHPNGKSVKRTFPSGPCRWSLLRPIGPYFSRTFAGFWVFLLKSAYCVSDGSSWHLPPSPKSVKRTFGQGPADGFLHFNGLLGHLRSALLSPTGLAGVPPDAASGLRGGACCPKKPLAFSPGSRASGPGGLAARKDKLFSSRCSSGTHASVSPTGHTGICHPNARSLRRTLASGPGRWITVGSLLAFHAARHCLRRVTLASATLIPSPRGGPWNQGPADVTIYLSIGPGSLVVRQ